MKHQEVKLQMECALCSLQWHCAVHWLNHSTMSMAKGLQPGVSLPHLTVDSEWTGQLQPKVSGGVGVAGEFSG